MMDGLSDYDYVQVTAWRGLTTSRPRRLVFRGPEPVRPPKPAHATFGRKKWDEVIYPKKNRSYMTIYECIYMPWNMLW